MLNLEEINSTIKKLEDGETTFANCEKLAALYTVRKHFKGEEKQSRDSDMGDDVTTELSDILPQYKKYCEAKRKYKQHETTEQPVIFAMANVCLEIKEFIKSLYSSTDMEAERDQIRQMVAVLPEIIG
ncbi:MAG: hypothetical protein J1F01_08625 [Oscillospiraceae bacterium]|nr:hypothetical protein [Oscillospiraceae bacterium]